MSYGTMRLEHNMVAYTQDKHQKINAREYPGTRQLCCKCEEPTERCEEDSIYIEDDGPLCEVCYDNLILISNLE